MSEKNARSKKRAAEELGRCPENDRDHVPGDIRLDLSGVCKCIWCREEVYP